jgi:hypothetical protein
MQSKLKIQLMGKQQLVKLKNKNPKNPKTEKLKSNLLLLDLNPALLEATGAKKILLAKGRLKTSISRLLLRSNETIAFHSEKSEAMQVGQWVARVFQVAARWDFHIRGSPLRRTKISK